MVTKKAKNTVSVQPPRKIKEQPKIPLDIYFDYRKYLKETVAQRKGVHGFSLRRLTSQAGFASSGFISEVISGRKNLSPASAIKLGKALGFNNEELTHFDILVRYNQAKEPEEKAWLLQHILRSNPGPSGPKVPAEQWEFYSHWLHAVIREILHCLPFKGDAGDLARRIVPAQSVENIRDSIQLLNRLGLIKRNAQGVYKPTDRVIALDDPAAAPLLNELQRQMLDLARDAFTRWPREERLMSSSTLSLSQKQFLKACGLIRQMRRQLLELAKSDEESDRVFQLSIAFFPLSFSV